MENNFKEFTDEIYSNIVKKASQKWPFISFKHAKKSGKACLWRHDIDFSLNRALKLAEIENACGVRATYFIHLHSIFYNPFEIDQAKIIQKIISLGHWIGLHFEPHFYLATEENIEWKKHIEFERYLLKQISKTDINSVSFHNPDVNGWENFNEEKVCSMINTYSNYISKNYYYISDSNGYWRYKNLIIEINNSLNDKIHILTHPGHWQEKAMSPNDRIKRCLDGRARKAMNEYNDSFSRQLNRINIK